MDAAGNLYGTTENGGIGNGTVFELQRTKSGFVYRPLYSFEGGDDGEMPFARVTIGPNGSLYGTTVHGGGTQFPFGVGTVFNVPPPPSACKAALCPWRETILFPFNQGSPIRAALRGLGRSSPFSAATKKTPLHREVDASGCCCAEIVATGCKRAATKIVYYRYVLLTSTSRKHILLHR